MQLQHRPHEHQLNAHRVGYSSHTIRLLNTPPKIGLISFYLDCAETWDNISHGCARNGEQYNATVAADNAAEYRKLAAEAKAL
jgi:hypothetical protein